MKQLVQSMRQGTVEVVDVPTPQLRGPGVLVQTFASLISAGTERAAMEFAKGSLLDKARSRPDLVKQVVQKVRRDGLTQAFGVAMSRLDKPVAPGYACAGTVVAVSPDLSDLAVGDPVACAGAGFATHAEVNFVPKNLVVPIPKLITGESVGFDEGAFTTLGAIALHGVRLAQPQLGDRAVVIGLGAVGHVDVQILRAHGCRVAGVDLDGPRCDLARALGANLAETPEKALAAVATWTRELSRDKGRIVAVGATGLDVPRRLMYHKELSLVVSRSYGPGRYDPDYEEHGRDYPLPYVRWTERENMRAFLDLVAEDAVDVRPLISHRFPIEQAERAYKALSGSGVLSIILDYPHEGPNELAAGLVPLTQPTVTSASVTGAAVSFIGTGNFARGVLLPIFAKQADAHLRGAVAATGLSAKTAAEKFGFAYCATSASDVWKDADCNAVVIATRHDAHAGFVIDALKAGKAAFVEKPLCLSGTELDAIIATTDQLRSDGRSPFLMVGFNRRFAAATAFLKAHFERVQGPVNVVYRINGGRVPRGSWVTSADEGGGRILGEVCHFVDLCASLGGASVTQVSAVRSSADADDVMVSLRLSSGGVATIAYLVDGDPASPKERIEVFGGGALGVIDDFRVTTLNVNGRKKKLGGRLSGQDKGHSEEVRAFVMAIADGAQSPVQFGSAVNSTRATLAILASLESGTPVDVTPYQRS